MVNDKQTAQFAARIFRGVLLLVFVAAVILPFCTSFFLCAMPCCHRAPSPAAALGAPMPVCPGSPSEGCATEMSAAVEHSSSTAATPSPAPLKLAVAAMAAVAPQIKATPLPAEMAVPAPSAPLHVLNSVFRI